MVKCSQCFSEISEVDVFCPFCGISLRTVEVPSEEDEFASTIMMPSGSVAPEPEIEAQIVEEPPVAETFEPEPEPEPEPELAPTPEPEPVVADHVDYSDIPTPPALADLERQHESYQDERQHES